MSVALIIWLAIVGLLVSVHIIMWMTDRFIEIVATLTRHE